MSQSLHLFSLQKNDLQIDRINARLNEIEKILQSDQSVIEAQNKLNNINEKYKNAKRALGLIEDEVQANKIKQENSESSLYGGRIHNPKELQDIQKEIDTRKKLLNNLEEKQLEAMITVEEIEKEKGQGENELSLAQSAVIQQKASLTGERNTLLKSKSNLEKEKEGITASLNPNSLQIYSQLRKQKKGLAVSKVEDNACASCGSDLRPEEIQLVKSSSQLYFCISCGRILFMG